MRYVVTLVAADQLTEDMVAAVTSQLHPHTDALGSPDWLAQGKACDLELDTSDLEPVRVALDQALAGHPIDSALLEQDGRRKQLLVSDMESTIIRNELINELAARAGRGAEVEAVTDRAMNGELGFAEALHARVAVLEGLPLATLDESAAGIFINPGAGVLAATMNHHGATTALVSGGFEYFTQLVAAKLGFDRHFSNFLLMADGQLTGKVREPVLDGDTKRSILLSLCEELNLDPSQAAAIGDGANDLPMIGAAGLGVAYHGKPVVAAAAGFRIDHGDLETLLYFQGYRDSDIVRPD